MSNKSMVALLAVVAFARSAAAESEPWTVDVLVPHFGTMKKVLLGTQMRVQGVVCSISEANIEGTHQWLLTVGSKETDGWSEGVGCSALALPAGWSLSTERGTPVMIEGLVRDFDGKPLLNPCSIEVLDPLAGLSARERWRARACPAAFTSSEHASSTRSRGMRRRCSDIYSGRRGKAGRTCSTVTREAFGSASQTSRYFPARMRR